jgi:hypothetical protein
MSFLRHGQIYQSDVFLVSAWRRSCFRLRLRSHRLDEFAASYSLAGWSPPEPTSALPAGFIFNQPAETVNPHLRRVDHFSTGRMARFSTGIDTTWRKPRETFSRMNPDRGKSALHPADVNSDRCLAHHSQLQAIAHVFTCRAPSNVSATQGIPRAFLALVLLLMSAQPRRRQTRGRCWVRPGGGAPSGSVLVERRTACRVRSRSALLTGRA